MKVYLFGDNAIADEIFANPIWRDPSTILRVVDRLYWGSGISRVGSVLNVFEDIKVDQSDIFINCLGYKHLLARKAFASRIGVKNILGTYISPKASIAPEAKIGDGAIILGHAVVERGATVGGGSILWGGAHLCHDATLGPFSFMAAGVRLGGYSKTGEFCKFGFNSVVEEGAIVPASFTLKALHFFKANTVSSVT